jgi:hypothetical protein
MVYHEGCYDAPYGSVLPSDRFLIQPANPRVITVVLRSAFVKGFGCRPGASGFVHRRILVIHTR